MDYRDKIRKRDCMLLALIYTVAAAIWWYWTYRVYQTPESYSSLLRVGITALATASVFVALLNWYRWFMYDRKK